MVLFADWPDQSCNLTDKKQAGPEHRFPNRRESGKSMLDTWSSDLQMSAARPGARLGVGGPRERLGGGHGEGEVGQARPPE